MEDKGELLLLLEPPPVDPPDEAWLSMDECNCL